MASNFCQICENLQEKPDGNASPRGRYVQPTCYDHVEDFQKYCKNIELEKEKEKCHNYLTTEADKFTNFTFDTKKVDEILKNFTSEQLHEFKEQMKTGILDINKINTNKKDENEKKSASNKKLRECSTRSPIKCPVSICSQIVGFTSILAHFLRDHQKHELVPSYQELKQDEKVTLEFSHKIFDEADKVLCLGIIIYAGDKTDQRPADQGLCLENSFLPEKYQNFTHHLPVLILGTKTYLKYILNEDELNEHFPEIYEDIEIYVLWLTTVDLTKKVHCTLTAYDKKEVNSRSSIVEIRSLKSSQNPKEFLSKETNYLILNCGEVDLLTKNENKIDNICLEMSIKQFD